MSFDYYRALYENSKEAFYKQKNCYFQLMPFYQYIDSSIKAYENKERIQAKWYPLTNEDIIELFPMFKLWKIMVFTDIQISIEFGRYRILNFSKFDPADEQDVLKLKFVSGKREVIENERLKLKQDILYIKDFERKEIESALWGFSTLDLIPDWSTIDESAEIRINGHKANMISCDSLSGKIRLAGELSENDILDVNGKHVNFEIVDFQKVPIGHKLIRNQSQCGIYYIDSPEKPTKDAQEIKGEAIYHFFDEFGDLSDSRGNAFPGKHEHNLLFRISEPKSWIGKTVKTKEGFVFSVGEYRSSDEGWIRIEEIEDESDPNDFSEISPLRYFFDDDIYILDESGNKYEVIKGSEKEAKLLLQMIQRQGERKEIPYKQRNPFDRPPKGEKIRVTINTYQLEKQMEAIVTLQDMPVCEHVGLLKLFDKKESKKNWPIFEKPDISEWFFLSDGNRSGVEEQRDFVSKAMGTPDICLLEGPPGSGKTTVILELICQLIRQNKKVLLCGSTHVAIDNVLERLNTKKNGVSTIDRLHILPIRIGDRNRISERIREFQLSDRVAESGIKEDLLLEASNLVCGTTIGILQHPRLKTRKMKRDNRYKRPFSDTPITPEFDVLIIDESSKTTFQEFLVPALYAKKWIVVGDVMQLSPFTDREQLVAGIESIQLKTGNSLSRNLQAACFVLQKIEEHIKLTDKTHIAACMGNEISELYNELRKRIENGDPCWKDRLVGFISSYCSFEGSRQICIFYPGSDLLATSAMNVLFIYKGDFDAIEHKLPDNIIILRKNSWESTSHAFRHNYWLSKMRQANFIRHRGKEVKGSFDIVKTINDYLRTKSWAHEIAWRVEREHQLRLSEPSKSQSYTRVIEELLPRSCDTDDVRNRINTVACAALPSVIECLIRGTKRKDAKVETVLTDGLPDTVLPTRRTTLKYQHRMHPDISDFPRRQFYSGKLEGLNALLDLELPRPIREDRQWKYKRYTKRCIWIHIKGKVWGNSNEDEVRLMMKELYAFDKFAQEGQHPENRKWTVSCLTFYLKQERKLREELRKFTGEKTKNSQFSNKNCDISLHTVDKFQGQEADVVFLSMVQNDRDGFLDSPNRLNVAITRARFQLVIIGNHDYFINKSKSDDLSKLASATPRFEG